MRGRWVVAALLLSCATATGQGPQAAGGGAPTQGSQATDFTLRDVEGRDVRLSDFAGKVVLIDFWATWCMPCEAEIPHLQALYETYQAKGLVVLGVAMDGPESVASVAPFVRRYGLSFPVLLDEETRVVSIYNPKRSAPLSVIIDRSGRVARTRQGFSLGDEKLIAQDVAQLLDAK